MEDQGEKGELRGRSRRSNHRDRSEDVRRSCQEVHDEARLVPVTPQLPWIRSLGPSLIIGLMLSSDTICERTFLWRESPCLLWPFCSESRIPTVFSSAYRYRSSTLFLG